MSSPLKAVVDHHVDRPGVEVERSMQLTGTNRLIGLIALICDTHLTAMKYWPPTQRNSILLPVFRRPGGPSEEPEPDPIPNSAVKLLSADGTMSQDMGEEVAARPAKD